MRASVFGWFAACFRRGGNPPAPAFLGNGKGNQIPCCRRLFLPGYAEVFHPLALSRWPHMSACRSARFSRLTLAGFFTNCQYDELVADACPQRLVQPRLDPD